MLLGAVWVIEYKYSVKYSMLVIFPSSTGDFSELYINVVTAPDWSISTEAVSKPQR